MVKEFLSQRGIAYKDRDVSRDPQAAQELRQRSGGRMAVPLIVVDGQSIMGFDQARLEQAIAAAQTSERPTFGAAVADAGKVAASPPGVSGAYVGRVRPDSAAQRAGLVTGDIITEINRQRISGAADLQAVLSRQPRGSRVSLLVRRGGSTVTIEAIL